MVTITVDGIPFTLREAHDVSFLAEIGKVFCVFDQNDSGNISFGVDSGCGKFFVKVAGLPTISSAHTPEEAVALLKAAMPVYEAVQHPNLIQLVRHFSYQELYLAVFQWADGECFFDHWNFDKYRKNPELLPPRKRFQQLPMAKRLNAVTILFSFFAQVAKSGYVAADFYDGSLMYDFLSDTLTICDIDYFRRRPAFNDVGPEYCGTKRLKAPEEYRCGAVIDERTNVFTLGALLFHFFGKYTDADIQKMYEANAFFPCSFQRWELSRPCYNAVFKAVSPERKERYASIGDFLSAWNTALQEETAL